jgi:hypothetical protein
METWFIVNSVIIGGVLTGLLIIAIHELMK